jgi:hypothetical protein
MSFEKILKRAKNEIKKNAHPHVHEHARKHMNIIFLSLCTNELQQLTFNHLATNSAEARM